MRDPIEKYLEDVLCYADLAAADEPSVRAELSEHIHLLVDSYQNSTPTEIYAMLKEQFGAPKRVGRAIAAAKGRMRTWFKKRVRKLPLKVGIALVLVFSIRYAVAQPFYVSGNGAAPMIPRGSRILVYKLARSFSPGDIVVFKIANGEYRVGSIVSKDTADGWLIERNKQVQDIAHENIVGRVFLNTR
jgi:hypothetical protein